MIFLIFLVLHYWGIIYIGLIGNVVLWSEPIKKMVRIHNIIKFLCANIFFIITTIGNERTTIKDPFTDPMGLIGVNIEDKSHNLTNLCSNGNGGCKHLCLFKPSGAVCACASGMHIQSFIHIIFFLNRL